MRPRVRRETRRIAGLRRGRYRPAGAAAESGSVARVPLPSRRALERLPRGNLLWKWRDYRFESAFDHPDIVAEYRKYRSQAGRRYVTENGHVWVNVPHGDVEADKTEEIQRAVAEWKDTAETEGNAATLRLVNRRLVATSTDDDPANGHLPIHIGHLGDFDDGLIPRLVVDDPTYHEAVAEYENVWE